MKKRRNLVLALLLVAAIALGVGYAALQSDLVVSGEAALNAENSRVYFSAASLNTAESEGAVTLAQPVVGEGVMALTLNTSGFLAKNDKAVVDVTVKNPHDYAVRISDVKDIIQDHKTAENGDEFFKIETSGLAKDAKIAAGETMSFKVIVTCQATSGIAISENFRIVFTVTADANAAPATT